MCDGYSGDIDGLYEEKQMNVLSLFDGMSCGQIALKKIRNTS